MFRKLSHARILSRTFIEASPLPFRFTALKCLRFDKRSQVNEKAKSTPNANSNVIQLIVKTVNVHSS